MDLNNTLLYEVTKKDVPKAVDTLTEAFLPFYPVISCAIDDKAKSEKVMKILFNMFVKYTIKYGKVYALDKDINEVVLWLFSNKMDVSLSMFIREEGLYSEYTKIFDYCTQAQYDAIMGVLDQFEDIEKDLNIEEPYMYLDLIGVNPAFQKQGKGKKLVQPILDILDQNEQKSILLTFTQGHVKTYMTWGYKLVKEYDTNNGFKVYLMVR